MFVARKISSSKWEKHPEFSAGEIRADAVTADLRTKGDALSFWRCGSGGITDVENVALAIAAAGDRIERVDVVWLPTDQLVEDRQTFMDSPGTTPVADLVNSHVDLTRLDLVRLGRLANRVVEAIGAGRCQRVPQSRVKSLLMNAVLTNRIDPQRLSQKIRGALKA